MDFLDYLGRHRFILGYLFEYRDFRYFRYIVIMESLSLLF